MLELIFSAIIFVLGLVVPSLGRRFTARFSPPPIEVTFGENVHYAPMSGIAAVAPLSFLEDAKAGTSVEEMRKKHALSYHTSTPLVIGATNVSPAGRSQTVFVREVWLTLVRYVPLAEVMVEDPVAVFVGTVAASGRGSDVLLGGKVCSTEPMRIPLMQQSAAADGLGSHRLSVDADWDLEIELSLVAEMPGRYSFDIDVDVQWGRRRATVNAARGLRLLETPTFAWVTAVCGSFAWQDLDIGEGVEGSELPDDWYSWEERRRVPCDGRRFVALSSDESD